VRVVAAGKPGRLRHCVCARVYFVACVSTGPVQDTNRNIRAQQRRQIIQELEDAELTFSPDINPRSKEVGCVFVSFPAALPWVCHLSRSAVRVCVSVAFVCSSDDPILRNPRSLSVQCMLERVGKCWLKLYEYSLLHSFCRLRRR
jgi:hypothetical protein